MQPVARLKGRLKHGLTLWRKRGKGASFRFPWRRTVAVWAERWAAPESRLATLKRFLHEANAAVLAGGDYDPWDLEVRSGLLGGARLILAPEEHGAGRQNLIFRIRPFAARSAKFLIALLALLAVGAALGGGAIAAVALGGAAAALAAAVIEAGGLAVAVLDAAVGRLRGEIDATG
jgi:hypothetical protein